jgi:hypothetical protein
MPAVQLPPSSVDIEAVRASVVQAVGLVKVAKAQLSALDDDSARALNAQLAGVLHRLGHAITLLGE